jgi:hypothetical protein
MAAGRQQSDDRREDFKMPVSNNPQAEHRPAEGEVFRDGRPGHVLDHVRQPKSVEGLSGRPNQIGIMPDGFFPDVIRLRVRLTRRTRMDGIEFGSMGREIFQRVTLDKLERKSGLRFHIDTDDGESCPVIAERRPARPAE